MPTRLRVLKGLLWFACVLMAVATVNEVVVWTLYAFNNSNPNYAFGLLVAAAPLLVAAMIAAGQPGLSTPDAYGESTRWVRWVTGAGFVPIAVGGFWTVMFLSNNHASVVGPQAHTALVALRYTLVAALIADGAAAAMAWTSPLHFEAVTPRKQAQRRTDRG